LGLKLIATAMSGEEEDNVQVWTLESSIPISWSADAKAQLDVWKQGDVLLDLPLTWLGPASLDQIVGVNPHLGVDDPELSARPFYNKAIRAHGVVVCSQTCDIAGTGPGDRHPFVEVAPLISGKTLSTTLRKMASRWRVGYLIPTALGANNLPESEDGWFVDLRLIFPISKSLLLGREPLDQCKEKVTNGPSQPSLSPIPCRALRARHGQIR
jgi:hypothetical protein